jgi:AcrR family transcriptional regulator
MEPDAATRPRRGRPRSESCREAIVAAAGDIMLEGGLKAATIEAIAARAGVGKATVYKWWDSRGAVALEGFMAKAADSWSLPEDASAPEALRILAVAAVKLFTESSAGPLMRALTADAQAQPELARALREHWLAPRRAVAAEIIRQGVGRRELRADIDVDLTLDLVFAPIYYRLLYGHGELTVAFALSTVDAVLTGVATAPPNPADLDIPDASFN